MPKQTRRKRGSGSIFVHGRSWYIAYYFYGEQIKEKIGSTRLITKGQAEQALKARIGEIIQGRFKIEGIKKSIYFKELISKYITWIKDNQKTHSREDSVTKIFFNYIGNKRIDEITTWQIEQYKSHRKKEGLKPSTINRELNVLRSMFNRALDWGEIKSNPLKGVKKALPLKEEDHERKAKYIEQNDFNLIVEHANQDLRDFIMVGRFTGMRVSEIAGLRVKDIYLENEEIFIKDSKNYTQRTVPMHDRVKEILSELIKDKTEDENVFKYKNRNSMGIAWRRLLESLNMKRKYTPHDMRHSFITDLVTKGFDLKTIMEITGHKDIRMLIERYTHPSKEQKKDAVKSLEAVNLQNKKLVSIF